MAKKITDQEKKEARLEGYRQALKDFADNDELNIKSYKANLDLEEVTKKSSSDEWWDKNSSALIAVIGTIIVAFFGFWNSCDQNRQKDRELGLKNIELASNNTKMLGDLIEKLASDKPLERRFATFAAMNLNVKDFDKYVISSLNSVEDAGTLEILLGRLIENKQDETQVRRKLSFLYTIQTETIDDEKEAGRLSQLALDILPKDADGQVYNAQARYRLGRILQAKSDFDGAIGKYNEALPDIDKKENIYARDGLKVALYARLGECFYGLNESEKAVENFKEAKRILNEYPNKNQDDFNLLGKLNICIESKENCKIDD
jgi:tetratricopeptide (TPR) repeat protein